MPMGRKGSCCDCGLAAFSAITEYRDPLHTSVPAPGIRTFFLLILCCPPFFAIPFSVHLCDCHFFPAARFACGMSIGHHVRWQVVTLSTAKPHQKYPTFKQAQECHHHGGIFTEVPQFQLTTPGAPNGSAGGIIVTIEWHGVDQSHKHS